MTLPASLAILQLQIDAVGFEEQNAAHRLRTDQQRIQDDLAPTAPHGNRLRRVKLKSLSHSRAAQSAGDDLSSLAVSERTHKTQMTASLSGLRERQPMKDRYKGTRPSRA